MNSATKGALRSKRVWGSVMVLAGAFGMPFVPGVDFDPDTLKVTIDLADVAPAVLTALIPGGGILAGVGGLVAKKAIKGLW